MPLTNGSGSGSRRPKNIQSFSGFGSGSTTLVLYQLLPESNLVRKVTKDIYKKSFGSITLVSDEKMTVTDAAAGPPVAPLAAADKTKKKQPDLSLGMLSAPDHQLRLYPI